MPTQSRGTYSGRGWAKAVQYPDGREASYTYGKSGERTDITYPDRRKVHYGYDEQVMLSEMRDWDRLFYKSILFLSMHCKKDIWVIQAVGNSGKSIMDFWSIRTRYKNDFENG